MDERANRERDSHDIGLERGRYDGVLNYAYALSRERRAKRAMATMSEKAGGRFLELGCTSWSRWVEPAEWEPGELICINISERELDGGRELALKSKTRPKFMLMNANSLEFPDASFDCVYGEAMLHHLELEVAIREIARVLRPGGLAIFTEPMDMNPIGRLVRRFTPAARTPDERPFRTGDLEVVNSVFETKLEFYELFTVPAGLMSRVFFKNPENVLTTVARTIDDAIVARLPWSGPFFRVVMIIGRREHQLGR